MKYLIMFVILLLGTSCYQDISTLQTSIGTPIPTPSNSTPSRIDITTTISQITPTVFLSPTIAKISTPSPSSISSDKLLTFNGRVSREQMFEYEILDNLVFRLIPNPYGWDIWMGDKTEPLNDYVAVVTPPYYGMSARYIEGWHFRNNDNSGPNEPGEKQVNAPQKERKFDFILTETDYWIAYNGINTRFLPSEGEQEQAKEAFNQLESYNGILTIISLELGNLKIGEQAWVEDMEFEVELSLPSDFE
ncbi:MAG: hypothetical protein GY797_19390 [Deltaproteobacteria bacterium]|nr:hypothetical protein [Deltaproteobacteria bacterium]